MGTRQNRLAEAVPTSTHNLCFEQRHEKYQSFLSENFQFLEVNLSIYLNRHVFVMFGGGGVGADVAIWGYCHLQVLFFFYVIFRSLSKMTIYIWNLSKFSVFLGIVRIGVRTF